MKPTQHSSRLRGAAARRRERRADESINITAQEMAVRRLVAVLEPAVMRQHLNRAALTGNQQDGASSLARLQSARASYAVVTNHGMERVGPGAWVSHRLRDVSE